MTKSTLLEALAGTADDRALLSAIRAEVTAQEGVVWEFIIAPRRFRATLDIRRRAEAVYRALAERPHPAILATLFNRDRSTIIYDMAAHDTMLFADKEYASRYAALLKGVVDRLKISTLHNNQNNTTPMFTSTISGNLGRAAEIKTINGKDYYKFNLGVASTRKDAPTQWVSVLFYKSNDRLGELLAAGTGVLVQGRQETKAYTSKDGQPHADITIWADTLEITRYVKAEQGAPASDDLPAGDDDPIF